jgi:hypothetical protein
VKDQLSGHFRAAGEGAAFLRRAHYSRPQHLELFSLAFGTWSPMFIGHFAVGFAAKRVAPEIKLWQALLAASFIDVLWPVFLILGIETVAIEPGVTEMTPLNFIAYPWSHSLLICVVWAVAFGGLYRWRQGTLRGALWLGALVVSHWVLDFVSHRPDMPLVPWGGPKYGLGLWYSKTATAFVEAGMFAVGLALYLSISRARDRQGTWALWILAGVLVVAYAANLVSGPPPSVTAIEIAGVIAPVVGSGLAYWTDRHRVP